jgi:hypothetical protein
MRSAGIPQLIDCWTAAGVITDEQARRMRADVPAPAGRGPLIVEGVGYLGATLIVAALVLLAERYWAEFGKAGRLLVVGAAALLAMAGAAVPRRGDSWLVPLRALLWLAAVAGGRGRAAGGRAAGDQRGQRRSGRTRPAHPSAHVPCADRPVHGVRHQPAARTTGGHDDPRVRRPGTGDRRVHRRLGRAVARR